MAGKVENAYGALAFAPHRKRQVRREDYFASVGRPTRICLLPIVFGEKASRVAALGKDDPGFQPALRRGGHKQDFRAVRRPTHRYWLQRRTAQLHAPTSVLVGHPEDAVEIGYVRHSLADF